MKISDEIVLSARNLTRRKGRTALTLIGVVIGTCMVVLMISLGIAQSQANDEMLQSWGDLTQIQVYGGGRATGADGKVLKLDDTAIESFKKLDHVMAATAYVSAYSLQGSVTAGTNDRYVMDLSSLTGVDPTALEPMGFQLSSGRWPDTGPANSKATKIQVLVGDYTGYNFYDSRKSENSPNRYRWQGMTDAQGNPLEPFVNVDKDKMTLTIKTGEESTEKTQTWELEVVGHIQQDASKGWWTQSNIILRTQDLKMIEEAYYKMAKITNRDKRTGGLAEAVKGADVFIGVSAPGALTVDMVKTMNKDAVIFACANPTPEIFPDEAKKAGNVAVIATGRSDFPNQVNNVLAFPGIFRGAFDVRASDINDEMKIAAAEALAAMIPDDKLNADHIIPAAFEPGVGAAVAKAVAQAARDSGVARL